MQRSVQRRLFGSAPQRAAGTQRKGRRLVVALTAIVVVGGVAAVAQVSSAGTIRFPGQRAGGASCGTSATKTPPRRGSRQLPQTAADPALDSVNDPAATTQRAPATTPPAGQASSPGGASTPAGGTSSSARRRGSSSPAGGSSGGATNPCPASPSASSSQGGSGGGLVTLGNSCEDSKLQSHTGFQDAPRCVGTAFGEVGAAAQNPSLLITQAPQRVRVNQPFTLQVSTRNLVRDRFLAAAAGGYYVESSFLDPSGLQRGHFHTACRMLQSTSVAPDPAPVPAFFKATEDGGGGARPDTVTVELTAGLPTAGLAQCAVWAGDGSHRLPMMQRANQTPPFDIVRITVTQ